MSLELNGQTPVKTTWGKQTKMALKTKAKQRGRKLLLAMDNMYGRYRNSHKGHPKKSVVTTLSTNFTDTLQ